MKKILFVASLVFLSLTNMTVVNADDFSDNLKDLIAEFNKHDVNIEEISQEAFNKIDSEISNVNSVEDLTSLIDSKADNTQDIEKALDSFKLVVDSQNIKNDEVYKYVSEKFANNEIPDALKVGKLFSGSATAQDILTQELEEKEFLSNASTLEKAMLYSNKYLKDVDLNTLKTAFISTITGKSIKDEIKNLSKEKGDAVLKSKIIVLILIAIVVITTFATLLRKSNKKTFNRHDYIY